MIRPTTRVVAAALLLVLAAAIAIALAAGHRQKHLSAEFANTIGLYAGAPVEILGVRIGTVDSVLVRGTVVDVEMSYDGSRSIPADAQAVIVPPSLAGDRFVQLTPPFTGGPALPDGARLEISHTQVPMELDQAFKNIDGVAKALGPNGANAEGALSRLLNESASNLRGNGDALRQTIHETSGAVGTLSDSRQDITGTVSNLGALSATLAGDDSGLRSLVDHLTSVSAELNGQRDELSDAVRNLNKALEDVAGFIRDNRDGLTDNVANLARVTATVADHQRGLAELLDEAPLAYTNGFESILPLNYDPAHPEAVNPAARTALGVVRSGGVPTTPSPVAQLGPMIAGLCSPSDQTNQQTSCAAIQRRGTQLLNDLGPSVLAGLGTPTATAPGAEPRSDSSSRPNNSLRDPAHNFLGGPR